MNMLAAPALDANENVSSEPVGDVDKPGSEDLPRSKALILEADSNASRQIIDYCHTHKMVAQEVSPEELMHVLEVSVDLGALFVSDAYDFFGVSGAALAHRLHRSRPELPIFLRLTDGTPTCSYDEDGAVTHAYTLQALPTLDALIESSLFSRVYPAAMVRGISQISRQALEGLITGVTVRGQAPVIARDRLIYGEVYSLMPLESHWCRGYMMLQIRESELQRLNAYMQSRWGDPSVTPSIRASNQMFGEITNVVWGAFKNKFVCYDRPLTGYLTQVPIVINHIQRYISFGSDDPQLCFRYLIDLPSDTLAPVEIHQRVIFNLSWLPEQYWECAVDPQAALGGELDLF